MFLTAAYRLDVIDAAKESTTSDKVSYRIDFGSELLLLTVETLLRINTAEHAPNVAAALEDGDVQGAAEAFLGSLDESRGHSPSATTVYRLASRPSRRPADLHPQPRVVSPVGSRLCVWTRSGHRHRPDVLTWRRVPRVASLVFVASRVQ